MLMLDLLHKPIHDMTVNNIFIINQQQMYERTLKCAGDKGRSWETGGRQSKILMNANQTSSSPRARVYTLQTEAAAIHSC